MAFLHTNKIHKVILIGCGSIGRHHLQKLSQYFDQIIVVDPRAHDLSRELSLIRTKTGSCRITFLENLSLLDVSELPASALVSNWGPDHVESVASLMAKGVRRFAVEKPLADSLEEIQTVEQWVSEGKIDFIMNMPWRRGPLVPALKDFAGKFDLGKPTRVLAQLGAAGFSEIGVHVLDVSEVFFGSTPQRVTSKMFDSSINPRNSSLSYFGGTAVFDFDGMNQLVITLHNAIRTSGSVFFEWEYGYVKLDVASGSLRGKIVQDVQALRQMPPNRTSRASVSHHLLEDVWAESLGYDVIYEFLRGKGSTDIAGTSASKNIIGALEANAQGRTVALSSLATNLEVSKKWNIT